jgi:hypothetical protein
MNLDAVRARPQEMPARAYAHVQGVERVCSCTHSETVFVCFSLYLLIKRFNHQTGFISMFLIFMRTKLDHTLLYISNKKIVLKINI